MLTECGAAAATYGAAVICERALGLPPASLGERPAHSLIDGLAVGLLAGALAHAAAGLWGAPLAPGSPALSALLLAPVAEERLFRGVLCRILGPLASAVVFALVHLRGPLQTAALLAIGLVLARVFERHGLAACFGLHAGLNVAALPP